MTEIYSNLTTKLKDFLDRAQDDMANLKKNLEMYNQFKDKVSKPYQKKMEKIKRNLNFVIAGSQVAFVCSYSYVSLKLILFNHYRRLNPITKFTLLSLYCLTIEPFTLTASYIGTSLYMRTDSFQNDYLSVFQQTSNLGGQGSA